MVGAFVLAGRHRAGGVHRAGAPHPPPDAALGLFSDRRFSVGNLIVTVAFFVMFGFFFLLASTCSTPGVTRRWTPTPALPLAADAGGHRRRAAPCWRSASGQSR